MTLRELMAVSCRDEVQRGFMADVDNPDVTLLATKVHGEMSEAWEGWRTGDAINNVRHVVILRDHGLGNLTKPDGFPTELADIVILIASFCERYNVPLEQAIREKLAYNRTRPPKNGKRV